MVTPAQMGRTARLHPRALSKANTARFKSGGFRATIAHERISCPGVRRLLGDEWGGPAPGANRPAQRLFDRDPDRCYLRPACGCPDYEHAEPGRTVQPGRR